MSQHHKSHNRNHAYSFTACTANVLNLALPNRVYYENQRPYSQRVYDKKVEWLGDFINTMNPDILAVQEVWDEEALRDVAVASGLQYMKVVAPVAKNTPRKHGSGHDQHRQNADFEGGAQGTPAVGFITRMNVLNTHVYSDMPEGCAVDLPEVGHYSAFSRPPLHLEVETERGQKLHVVNVHLKSKRPKFLRDANNEPLEDMDDPKIRTRAKMRSLCMRAAEAAALRHIIIDLLHRTHDPLILMGDLNDNSHSVTTQLLAETNEVAYDRAMHDIALFNAYENQTRQALHKDVAYSHIYQGYPEVLDQIFVSEEFLRHSKFSIGEVLRVDYFNDHLKLPRDKAFSDHGFVKAVIRVEGD